MNVINQKLRVGRIVPRSPALLAYNALQGEKVGRKTNFPNLPESRRSVKSLRELPVVVLVGFEPDAQMRVIHHLHDHVERLVREQRLWKLVLEFDADGSILFNSGRHIRLSVDEL